jgi:hypothetical protein
METNKNHPLVLSVTKQNRDTGEGHTIFKNTDEVLIAKIKALNVQSDTWIEHHRSGECKIVQVLNEKQRLCVDESNIYFLKNVEDFESTRKENLLNNINSKFNAASQLNKSLGDLYTSDGYRKVTFTGTKAKLLGAAWQSYGEVSYEELGIRLETHGGIKLYEGLIGGRGMNCHFNEEGNIINRDYDFNIRELLDNKSKTRKDLVEEILKCIPDVPYENYGNKWFYSGGKKKNSWDNSDGFALVINKPENSEKDKKNNFRVVFDVTRYDHISGDNFGDWQGKIKKPKTVKPSSREEILLKILPLVNTLHWFGEEIDLSPYIDLKKFEVAPEEKKTIVKRVQKTKLKEKSFDDIYDFTNGDYDIYDYFEDENERKKLFQALLNIECGIEPGESEDIIKDLIIDFLKNGDLPSFSFDKGQKQENHDKYKGLVKLPHGCNFTFKVAEGDACEITWAHSIYSTDVVEFELVS